MSEVEKLAGYAHEAWSGWMRYLFEKSAENPDGSVTIPAELVKRWRRQLETPYEDLPEKEKDSDRIEARKIQATIGGASTIRRQVEAFCVAGGHPVLDSPQVPADGRVKLRVRLVMEEFFEFLQSLYPLLKSEAGGRVLHQLKDAVDCLKPDPDLVELADALADLDYVVEGTRLEFGIDGGPVAEEVQRSNMAKFGPGSWTRSDGKIMKPPDWTPPDVEGELRKQGWED